MTEFERMQEFSKGALIAELEVIKYEMLLKRDSVDLFQSAFNWNIELIEKHIAELKGENNDLDL